MTDAAARAVTRDDVVKAYELILGRPPESEEAVRSHLGARDLSDLRRQFFHSEEFRTGSGGMGSGASVLGRHMTAPPAALQLDGPPDQLAAMLARVGETWRQLGEEEPHWSVLTSDDYRQDKLAEHIDAFYASGRQSVALLKAALKRADRTIDPSWTAFELGCGVGRITAALAGDVTRVIGCDISRPHLEIARRYAEQHGIGNIDFRHLDGFDVLDRLEPFDLFFSLIVLQHNPPPVIGYILDRIFAALKPGGFAFFQVPTYCLGYRFVWDEYLARPIDGMEMHMFPQAALFELFARHGMICIEVQEDAFTADTTAFVSNTFLVRKSAAHDA
ncbi:Methyltransferase domain-containing protein [Pseudoxanthobacter soli DSM 19599]|uniref:Methyltransferase domain-containing protein n=1 Tax=Pseudoxanthobacter soli DSM 19599 TaxID=1123029 RepID=A0A1M7ZQL1_9HYPH|nr:class I SAM-dependent methyltransferase [Pseudoxanthobacter soli]SHO67198.1 Methyltransferase domain-containing protein [Pseudoxanthobacter soli DSM 19599]